MNKRRAIDPAERALWHEAMHDVARHRGKKIGAIVPADSVRIDQPPVVPAKAGNQEERRQVTSDSRVRGNDAGGNSRGNIPGLDRRNALRLKRGQLPVEARLDLHGLTQDEAHRALAGFVARGHAAGKRVLLIVTGKGSREGSGVLRAAVPRWLHEPALRARILATAPAVPRDGGCGALYILLRRAR